MIIVSKASVILRWSLEKASESDQVQARLFQDAILTEQIEIKLPTLWRFEFGHVLDLRQPELAKELLRVLLT